MSYSRALNSNNYQGLIELGGSALNNRNIFNITPYTFSTYFFTFNPTQPGRLFPFPSLVIHILGLSHYTPPPQLSGQITHSPPPPIMVKYTIMGGGLYFHGGGGGYNGKDPIFLRLNSRNIINHSVLPDLFCPPPPVFLRPPVTNYKLLRYYVREWNVRMGS